ncbi:hypothetical protein [Nonomuraea insulae]|uniref:Uncharacterized protein n=1 Tax=Nonomuraea insulae TaxID=1616787 RepID=A0ABW1D4A2_9ACTN
MPVIVQRIVVDWGKDARGAREASLRRDIPRALDLPPLPDAPLAVHEINIACVPWRAELFMDGEFDGEKDERVSLYGGP